MDDGKLSKTKSKKHFDENFVPAEQERSLVTQLLIAGDTPKQIAKLVRGGISVGTLRHHFKPELQNALPMARVAASAELQKILRGLDGAPASVKLRAIELFLGQRGGEPWRKKAAVKADFTGESDKGRRKKNGSEVPVVKWTLNSGVPKRKK